MNQNNKGFINIVVAVIIVVVIGVVGYFAFSKKSEAPDINQNQSTSTVQTGNGTLAGPTLIYNAGSKPYVQIVFQYNAAEYFNVYRATNSNGPWQKINSEKYPSKAHAAVDYDFPKDAAILYYRLTILNSDGTESQPSPVGSVEIPNSETANWQTYRNDKYGFEFKYPKTVTLKDINIGEYLWKELKENTPINLEFIEKNSTTRTIPPGYQLMIKNGMEKLGLITDNLPDEAPLLNIWIFQKTKNFSNLDTIVNDWKTSIKDCARCGFSTESIKINGYTSIKETFGEGNARGNQTDEILIEKNDKVFVIFYSYDWLGLSTGNIYNIKKSYTNVQDGQSNLFQQVYFLDQKILQTFKFL